MSYRRSFSKTIRIPVSVSISQPTAHATESGLSTGSGHVTVNVDGDRQTFDLYVNSGHTGGDFTATQRVEVNIEVDTEDFDRESHDCCNQVDVLTGSVVATEAAEIASQRKNSRLISKTIVDGFFKQVKSEVSSKVMEYTHIVESKLMHLRQQSEELLKKQNQMQNDYQRTAARYTKLMDDLNHELENRVKALDQPIYKAFDLMQKETNRMLDGDSVDIAAVSSSENNILINQIQSGLIKKHAQDSIGHAKRFLYIQRTTDATIQKAVINGMEDAKNYYIPICYAEHNDNNGSSDTDFYFDGKCLDNNVKEMVFEQVLSDNSTDHSLDANHREQLKPYFNSSIQACYGSQASQHTERVKETIIRLFNS